jgi:hypothetical protein
MKLTVIEYNEYFDYHLCIDEEGIPRKVDLTSDGLAETVEDTDLVGKTVEVEGIIPWIEVGIGVSIMEKEE